ETYIRVDTSALADTPSAKLRLYVLDGGAQVGSLSLRVERVATNSGSESITFQTKPAGSGDVKSSITGLTVGQYVEIDITDWVQTEAEGDGILSLRLYSDNASTDRWVAF